MVGTALGLAAVAVAAQVGADDGEVSGQAGRDLVPHGMGLRIAVEQQQGRTAAALDQVDGLAAAGGDLHPLKSFKQSHRYSPRTG